MPELDPHEASETEVASGEPGTGDENSNVYDLAPGNIETTLAAPSRELKDQLELCDWSREIWLDSLVGRPNYDALNHYAREATTLMEQLWREGHARGEPEDSITHAVLQEEALIRSGFFMVHLSEAVRDIADGSHFREISNRWQEWIGQTAERFEAYHKEHAREGKASTITSVHDFIRLQAGKEAAFLTQTLKSVHAIDEAGSNSDGVTIWLPEWHRDSSQPPDTITIGGVEKKSNPATEAMETSGTAA